MIPKECFDPSTGISLIEWPPVVEINVAKEDIDYDFVFCIGGDGTLLRLLRILYFRGTPRMLPKIITFSTGSLNYLCNFQIDEYQAILDATVLHKPDSIPCKVDYRSRLEC